MDRFQAKAKEKNSFIGPGSYNPDKAFKLLYDNNSGPLFSKQPANLYQFENSQEFIMVGSQVKHVLNMKNMGGNILGRKQLANKKVSYEKMKSLKKLVNEQNNKMDDYCFKNFYG